MDNSNLANAAFIFGLKGYTYEAIAIGPNSDLDHCFILPPHEVRVPRTNSTGATQVSEWGSNVIAVSVERPYVGSLPGPFLIVPQYSQEVDVTSRWAAAATQFPYASSAAGAGVHGAFNLDLMLYEESPPWLPTRRAPSKHLLKMENFGTTGLSDILYRLPGWGRQRSQLSIKMEGRSAGDISWQFDGINHAIHPTKSFAHIVNLQPATVEAVNFTRSYSFDVEFDYYVLTVLENSALNSGVTVEAVFKSWDI